MDKGKEDGPAHAGVLFYLPENHDLENQACHCNPLESSYPSVAFFAFEVRLRNRSLTP